MPPLAVHIDDDVFELLAKLKGVLEVPAGYSIKAFSTASEEWPSMLTEEAEYAADDRLFISALSIKAITALVDLHLSPVHSGLPMAVDTHRQVWTSAPTC